MQHRARHRFPAVRPVVLLVTLLFAFEVPAMAYSDPGTGAMLWQLVAAGFLGALYRLRRAKDRFMRWRR